MDPQELMIEAGSRKPEAGSRKPEVLEAGSAGMAADLLISGLCQMRYLRLFLIEFQATFIKIQASGFKLLASSENKSLLSPK